MPLKQPHLTDNQFAWLNRWFSMIFRWPLLLLLLPWVVYFILDLITTAMIFGTDIKLGIPLIHAVFGFKVLIVFFYFSFDYSILRKNYLLAGLYTFVLLGIITTIKYTWINYLDSSYTVGTVVMANEMMRVFHFMGFSFFVWICYRYYLSVQQKLKVKSRLAELEIAHISLQLSPHFTMNVLNELLAKVVVVSKPVFFTLSRMSRILKYHYFTSGSTSLIEELSIVKDYLELQQQRFKCPIHLALKTNTDEALIHGLFIPKKILLTIVENIFKHGVVNDGRLPIIIRSTVCHNLNGSLTFSFGVTNKIDTSNASSSSTGFGLKAVRYLLGAYFPHRNFLSQEGSGLDHSLLLVITY